MSSLCIGKKMSDMVAIRFDKLAVAILSIGNMSDIFPHHSNHGFFDSGSLRSLAQDA